MSSFKPIKYCWHCDKGMGLARSDKRFCTDRCRVAWDRFQAKLARSNVVAPSHEALAAAKITMSWKVFSRELTVLDTLEKGLIRMELQPDEAQND